MYEFRIAGQRLLIDDLQQTDDLHVQSPDNSIEPLPNVLKLDLIYRWMLAFIADTGAN
jgi:hypothetical protein